MFERSTDSTDDILAMLTEESDKPSRDDAQLDLKEVLAKQLDVLVETLQLNFSESAALVAKQRDYYSALEVTNTQLQSEVGTLRGKLMSAGLLPDENAEFMTGGTGDSYANRSVDQSRDDSRAPQRAVEPLEIPLLPLVQAPRTNPVIGECTAVVPGNVPGFVDAVGEGRPMPARETPKGEPHNPHEHIRDADEASLNWKNSLLSDFVDSAPQKRKPVFADVEAMKIKIKEGLQKPAISVEMYYKDRGVCQAIARSPLFESLTLSIIGVNAIWIAIDTDYNTAPTPLDAHLGFMVVDTAFCLFFVFEWICRFMAFKLKRNGLKDFWFVFDSFLVIFMVFETWVTPAILYFFATGASGMGNGGILKLLRLLRLSRMARMARVLRAFPELMIIVRGLSVAIRSVIFTLAFLVLVVYVFAVVMVQLIGPQGYFEGTQVGQTEFPDILTAMNTLVLNTALPDQANLVNDLGAINFFLYVVIMVFMLLASITLMNMLVGVLCEVVAVVSAVEKEEMLLTHVKRQLKHMLQKMDMDTDNDGQISKMEFESLLSNPDAAKAMSDIGVDVVGLVDFTDFIFEDDTTPLTFADFMDFVLQLRGTNTATVKDIVDLRKMIILEVKQAVTEAHADKNEKDKKFLSHRESQVTVATRASRNHLRPE